MESEKISHPLDRGEMVDAGVKSFYGISHLRQAFCKIRV
jgi:hypothetical protein